MSLENKRMILLGAPGAGKGTLAKHLQEAYALEHISTGDLFRYNMAENTELGREAKAYIEKGHLVPDSLTSRMVFDRLKEVKGGFMLDGYPRNLAQAKALEEMLEELGMKLDFALEIAVDDDLVVKRLSARRTCPECGKPYNLNTMPPKVEGRCDVCGSELQQRKDDVPETIRQRLNVFHENTDPLFDFYRKQDILLQVNGDQTPAQVVEDVLRHMENLKRDI